MLLKTTFTPDFNAGFLRIKQQQKVGTISNTCPHSFITLTLNETHNTKRTEMGEINIYTDDHTLFIEKHLKE